MYVCPPRLGVVFLVPEFQQRGHRVPFRRLQHGVVLFLRPRRLIRLHKAARVGIVLLHPCHARACRLKTAAPKLNVFVHRVGIKILRMPGHHAGHTLSAVQIVVPEDLRHAGARHRRIFHQRGVCLVEFRLIEHEAHHVGHFFRALRRLFPFGDHQRFGTVVNLIGYRVVDAAAQRVGGGRRAASVLLFLLGAGTCPAHFPVFLQQVPPVKLKQIVASAQKRLFLTAERLFASQDLEGVKPNVARLGRFSGFLPLHRLTAPCSFPSAQQAVRPVPPFRRA